MLGHYIPAGTPVDCAYTVDHFLPELWTRPELFDPERFGEARRRTNRIDSRGCPSARVRTSASGCTSGHSR
ncbi:hypothetical protein [Nocardia sp. CA-135398]|uniref:hypothetical protein n=1 Tax=Nocardia sp. CA-135398 TaxID=3239977 RepID=UPI003D95676B